MESKKSVIIHLYRAFLLQCRALDKFPDPRMLLQNRPNRYLAPYRFLTKVDIRTEIACVSRLLLDSIDDPVISSSQLRNCIKKSFITENPENEKFFLLLLENGFIYLKRLQEQIKFRSCTSFNETNGIRVVVTSFPLVKDFNNYSFCYRIRIKNMNTRMVVQLKSRHWKIKSRTDFKEVPYGSYGVVGETPTLVPGDEFEYYSSVSLTSPEGTMQGCFEMVIIKDIEVTTDDSEQNPIGEKFDASVGPFKLIYSLNEDIL